jgi:hypothetical protein
LFTNAAIATIKRLSDNMEDEFDDFKETETMWMHDALVDFLDKSVCYLDCENLPPGVDDSTHLVDFRSTSPNEAVCHRMYLCLEDILNLWNNTDIYDAIDQTTTLTATRSPFFRCLEQLRLLPPEEAGRFHDRSPRIWAHDCIYAACKDVICEGNPNSWTAFAIQILWDTYRVLGFEIGKGASGLDGMGEDMHKQCGMLLTLASIAVWREMAILANIAREGKLESYIDGKETEVDEAHDDYFELLPNHPTLCGVMLADLRDAYHKISTDIAGFHGHILTVAHLYNAARIKKLIRPEQAWDDMDFFIWHQGHD